MPAAPHRIARSRSPDETLSPVADPPASIEIVPGLDRFVPKLTNTRRAPPCLASCRQFGAGIPSYSYLDLEGTWNV